MSKSSLIEMLNRSTIRRLAGNTYFERGEDYFLDEAVVYLSHEKDIIKGTVQGAYRYEVKLWQENRSIQYVCNCPIGKEGSFCKHCVAVALQWIHDRGTKKNNKKEIINTSESHIHSHLMHLNKEELATMIIEQMYYDDTFRERLILKANSSTNAKKFNQGAFKRLVDRSLNVGEFIHYRDMWRYAQNIDQVVNELEEIVDNGYAREGIESAEYFIKETEEAIHHVDDSDGGMGSILAELQEIHHKACQIVKPNPEELAQRLFYMELNAKFDIFYGAAQTYEDVLGKKGIAVYRSLTEEAWEKLPNLMPGDQDDWSSERFHLTSIMELLASKDNNIEKLVVVKSKNLSKAYSFLEIAKIYQESGKKDNALK